MDVEITSSEYLQFLDDYDLHGPFIKCILGILD